MSDAPEEATLTAEDVQALADFDAEAFIAGFQLPRFTAPLYRKANLIEQIQKLDSEIDLAEAESKLRKKRRSFADTADDARRIRERNDLVTELEASKVEFTFRPWDTESESKKFLADAKAAGANMEDDLAVACFGMALTCESHPLTPEQWSALRSRVGAAAFSVLANTWFRAVKTGGVTVPFSPRPSLTPETGAPTT